MKFENLHPTDLRDGISNYLEVMEVQDSETYAQKKKSERYGKIAIVFFLLLALLWGLGAFIVWILLGAATYFTFLFFYYQPRQPKASSWQSSKKGFSFSTSGNSTSSDPVQQKVKLVIQIVVGFFAFFIVILFIIGIFSDDDLSEDTTINARESTSDNARVLKDDPDNVDALTGIGNEFYDQSNYDSALFYYNKVLAIDSRNSPALYNKGLVFYNQKEYQQSIDLLKSCLSIDSSNKDAMYIMGHDYYDRQLYDDALNWYRQAYDAGMREAFLSHALGYLYDTKGNNTQSIFHYKEALQQDSSRADIYTRLAEMEPDKAIWYKAKAEQWKK